MEQVIFVGVERYALLVQTFGVTAVEVMFGYDRAVDQYTFEVANSGEHYLIRRPSRVRVQFEDGDWHNITPGYWIAERIEHGIRALTGTATESNCGACTVMPSPETAFIEAFNQNY